MQALEPSSVLHAPLVLLDSPYFASEADDDDASPADSQQPSAAAAAVPAILRSARERDVPLLRYQWLQATQDWLLASGAVAGDGNSTAAASAAAAITLPAATAPLVRRGVPGRLRGALWFRALGNDLGITPAQYNVWVEVAGAQCSGNGGGGGSGTARLVGAPAGDGTAPGSSRSHASSAASGEAGVDDFMAAVFGTGGLLAIGPLGPRPHPEQLLAPSALTERQKSLFMPRVSSTPPSARPLLNGGGESGAGAAHGPPRIVGELDRFLLQPAGEAGVPVASAPAGASNGGSSGASPATESKPAASGAVSLRSRHGKGPHRPPLSPSLQSAAAEAAALAARRSMRRPTLDEEEEGGAARGESDPEDGGRTCAGAPGGWAQKQPLKGLSSAASSSAPQLLPVLPNGRPAAGGLPPTPDSDDSDQGESVLHRMRAVAAREAMGQLARGGSIAKGRGVAGPPGAGVGLLLDEAVQPQLPVPRGLAAVALMRQYQQPSRDCDDKGDRDSVDTSDTSEESAIADVHPITITSASARVLATSASPDAAPAPNGLSLGSGPPDASPAAATAASSARRRRRFGTGVNLGLSDVADEDEEGEGGLFTQAQKGLSALLLRSYSGGGGGGGGDLTDALQQPQAGVAPLPSAATVALVTRRGAVAAPSSRSWAPESTAASTAAAIEVDLSRTFPELAAFFAEGTPSRRLMLRVLTAYSLGIPGAHYCQGMTHLVAVLMVVVGAAVPCDASEEAALAGAAAVGTAAADGPGTSLAIRGGPGLWRRTVEPAPRALPPFTALVIPRPGQDRGSGTVGVGAPPRPGGSLSSVKSTDGVGSGAAGAVGGKAPGAAAVPQGPAASAPSPADAATPAAAGAATVTAVVPSSGQRWSLFAALAPTAPAPPAVPSTVAPAPAPLPSPAPAPIAPITSHIGVLAAGGFASSARWRRSSVDSIFSAKGGEEEEEGGAATAPKAAHSAGGAGQGIARPLPSTVSVAPAAVGAVAEELTLTNPVAPSAPPATLTTPAASSSGGGGFFGFFWGRSDGASSSSAAAAAAEAAVYYPPSSSSPQAAAAALSRGSRTLPKPAPGPQLTLLPGSPTVGAGSRASAPVPAHPSIAEVEEALCARLLPRYSTEVLVFTSFCALVARAPLRWLVARDVGAFTAWCTVFRGALARHAPKVSRHLGSLGVAPEMFLTGWILTLFSKPVGLEPAARLWDRVILAGETRGHGEVLRCAVGLCALLGPRLLLQTTLEDAMRLLTRVPRELGQEDALSAAVDAVRITPVEAAALEQLERVHTVVRL